MSRAKSITLWYPEYPGDYARKTGHLSMAQHGAYLLLRQHYYSTGRPLPTNVASLYRVCGALEGWEQADVKAVLDEFFTLEDDGYHNSRCDEELAKRGDIRKKRQDAVNSRADRRGTIEPTNVDTPTPTPTVMVGGGGRAIDPHDEIVLAAGIDPVKDTAMRFVGSDGIATVARWRDLGLSQEEIITTIREVMAGKRDGPPASLAYFNSAMQRAAGRKLAPALTPSLQPEGVSNGRSPARASRSTVALDAALAGARRLPGEPR